MPDILFWITENGLPHFIPLLILIAIFVLLAEKVNTQIFSWSEARDYFFRMNVAFALVVVIIATLHVLEFFVESQALFSLPGGELGIEVVEFVLLYGTVFIFMYGLKMLTHIRQGRFH